MIISDLEIFEVVAEATSVVGGTSCRSRRRRCDDDKPKRSAEARATGSAQAVGDNTKTDVIAETLADSELGFSSSFVDSFSSAKSN